jgi:hypothetical protein
MTAYDSIERGAADECEPLRGRRSRTFTLTQLLVACGAVCVCAIGATMFVNTRLETTPSLGQYHKNNKFLWKGSSACKTQEKALKKDLMSCNADLKSKIDARSAELGDPVRNGRALLGSNSCASAMKKEQDLLAECKAELAVHDENTKLKAQIKLKNKVYNELYAAYLAVYGCANSGRCSKYKMFHIGRRYGLPSKYKKYTLDRASEGAPFDEDYPEPEPEEPEEPEKPEPEGFEPKEPEPEEPEEPEKPEEPEPEENVSNE